MEPIQLRNPVLFNGRTGEFYRIWIVNILLSIVTLGVYSAWAKVRTKRYFYGNTQIGNDRFEYHATPIQILIGRLIALACVVAWVYVSSVSPFLAVVVMMLFYLAFPWLLWINVRFDCAMTSFANVRFSFSGSLLDAYSVMLGRPLGVFVPFVIVAFFLSFFGVIGITLSIAISMIILVRGYAWVMQGVHQYLMNGYRYGQREFSAQLQEIEFVKIILQTLLICIGMILFVTMAIYNIGISTSIDSIQNIILSGLFKVIIIVFIFFVLSMIITAFFTVRVRNYIFSQAQLSNSQKKSYQFESSLTVLNYAWLIISNILAQIFSFGLARPWAMIRSARYVASKTVVKGNMSQLNAESLNENNGSSSADEIAQAFDVGIGIS